MEARGHAHDVLEDLASVGDYEGEGEEVGDDFIDIVSGDTRGRSNVRGRSRGGHVVNV